MFLSSSMESRHKKLKAVSCMDQDRISNVPGLVIDRILSCLPIKDAVKTSALSSKWKDRWTMIPSLVFDDMSFPVLWNFLGGFKLNKLVCGIDRVLLFHTGAVENFRLSTHQGIPDDDIDKWVLYLSKHSVKDLALVFDKNRNYSIPTYLFSCRNLTCLELAGCVLKPPPWFKSFKQLKSLDLQNMTSSKIALENLISSSPLLERLTLWGKFVEFNIDAPNLLFVELTGEFVGVNIKNSPRLADFSMHLSTISLNGDNGDTRNWLKLLLDSMPQVCRLSFKSLSLEYLGSVYLPKELSVPYVYLRNLDIEINLTSFKETVAFRCFLRSAPHLQNLVISSYWYEDLGASNEVWEAEKQSRLFNGLHHVRIVIFGMKAEMDFINFMLSTAPALLTMTVTLCVHNAVAEADRRKLELAKQLLGYNRASAQAKIFCLESPC